MALIIVPREVGAGAVSRAPVCPSPPRVKLTWTSSSSSRLQPAWTSCPVPPSARPPGADPRHGCARRRRRPRGCGCSASPCRGGVRPRLGRTHGAPRARMSSWRG